MRKIEIFEGFGFFILLTAVLSRTIISRSNIHVTEYVMAIGAAITFTAFFIRKIQDFRKKE